MIGGVLDGLPLQSRYGDMCYFCRGGPQLLSQFGQQEVLRIFVPWYRGGIAFVQTSGPLSTHPLIA